MFYKTVRNMEKEFRLGFHIILLWSAPTFRTQGCNISGIISSAVYVPE